MKKIVLLITVLLGLSSCSTRFENPQNSQQKQKSQELKKLYSYFDKWEGTPHLYGGTTLEGIDCSAFVQNAFYDVYGIDLPRTTKEQVTLGEKIPKKDIQTGDLIFSKTGVNERHVSIYLEGGKFMHVSEKKGVIISSMQNPYWKKHFWMIRRLE